MSKYTNKICNYINNIKVPILCDNTTFKTSLFLEKVVKSVYYAQQKSHEKTVPVKTDELKQSHSRDTPPLMYVLFKEFQNASLLDKIVNNVPDISDLPRFIKWYRERPDDINSNKIHNLLDAIDIDNSDYSKLIDIYSLMYKTTNTRNILHQEIYNNRFISLDVQYEMETTGLTYQKYKLDNKHNISVFSPDGNILDIEPVCFIIRMMENLAKLYKIHTPVVNLTILNSRQKKIFNREQTIISCDNINSGSTYPGHKIVCWRAEELHKVLIHELFHYYQYDFFHTDSYYGAMEKSLNIPSIKGIDMINECYTESCTVLILLTASSCIEYKLTHKNSQSPSILLDKIAPNIITKLNTELAFLNFQISKVTSFYGEHTFEEMMNGKVVYIQNTSFRSYFILKYALLYNLEDLLQTISENPVINGERLLMFGELINRSIKKMKNEVFFAKLFNDTTLNMKKHIKTHGHKWIYRTGRMTVHGNLVIA